MQKQRFGLRLLVARVVRRCRKGLAKPFQFDFLGLFLLSVLLLAQASPAALPNAADIQTPAVGDNALHILSPNLLELFLVNSKQPDPATVEDWNWVNGQQQFVAPNM